MSHNARPLLLLLLATATYTFGIETTPGPDGAVQVGVSEASALPLPTPKPGPGPAPQPTTKCLGKADIQVGTPWIDAVAKGGRARVCAELQNVGTVGYTGYGEDELHFTAGNATEYAKVARIGLSRLDKGAKTTQCAWLQHDDIRRLGTQPEFGECRASVAVGAYFYPARNAKYDQRPGNEDCNYRNNQESVRVEVLKECPW